VKTARGRKNSSTLWLAAAAQRPLRETRAGRRLSGRAAYKIMELDDKYRFLVPGARVVDLGCAPGGWCQVAVPRVNALGDKGGKAQGFILGVDLQEVEPIAGARFTSSISWKTADEKVKAWLGGEADVVMSDMAAASSGHKQTDHLRIIALCEAAAYFAFDVLEEGGTFVSKVLAGRRRRRAAKAAQAALRPRSPTSNRRRRARTVPRNSWWPLGSGAEPLHLGFASAHHERVGHRLLSGRNPRGLGARVVEHRFHPCLAPVA
jgi:23S rRNA (uridine2552-2'-O)-methyltransferase